MELINRDNGVIPKGRPKDTYGPGQPKIRSRRQWAKGQHTSPIGVTVQGFRCQGTTRQRAKCLQPNLMDKTQQSVVTKTGVVGHLAVGSVLGYRDPPGCIHYCHYSMVI